MRPFRRPIHFSFARVGSVCLAAALSAVVIVSLYSTLNQIENVLPRFGFFSIRELNVAIHDLSHLKDIVSLARLAPDEAESVERLAEANDLVYIRFSRQDQSPTIRGYPRYGPAVERAGAIVTVVDALLAKGRPLAVHDLEQISEELASIEAEMIDTYYAFGNATNADLTEIQRRLGLLNIQTAIVLAALSALAIGVAVLLVSRHRTLRSLRQLAWSDPLTKLKNRAWLLANIEEILRRATTLNRQMSLYLLDIDHFKEVNDTFGHQTGDSMLRVAGEILIALEEPNSAYAVRLGGDEFALLVIGSSDRNFGGIADGLDARLNTFVDLAGVQVRMGASIGIARFPEHGPDLSTLLRCADYALYAAKARGGSCYVAFSPDGTGPIERQLGLGTAIKRAILLDELFLVWQPQFELASGALSGAEALVRWRDPTKDEVVQPSEFIPAAERSDLILEIDRYVLTKACTQAAAWSVSAPPDFTFSVNLSAKHLQRPELYDFVRQTLEHTRLAPARLELEITESAFIENKQAALAALLKLQALGVRTALDDFGTGYSSLSYLVDLNVTRLKIDRSFIADLMTSKEKRSVVELIMALAKSLGLDVLAEGVETAEQTAFLMQLKCRYAQGFLLSRPVSAEEMTRLLSGEIRRTPALIEGAKRILAA
jgi:diguanylate cyclase (GGDEF)-like protein